VWRRGRACTAARPATADDAVNQRRWSLELGRRDAGFTRILSANVDEGQGIYEALGATGKTLQRVFTFDGERILTPRFGTRLNAVTTAQAPEPYDAGLTKLRADAVLLSTFEADFRAARQADLDSMRRLLDSETPPTLVTAEALSKYAPPNPYAAGIKALQEKKTR
jgi:hypothetical protein